MVVMMRPMVTTLVASYDKHGYWGLILTRTPTGAFRTNTNLDETENSFVAIHIPETYSQLILHEIPELTAHYQDL